eukprot:gene23226-28108_t
MAQVSESSECGSLEMIVEGEVIVQDPWAADSTSISAHLPFLNASVSATYNHRPVFELFGMDLVASTFGQCTDKPGVLINVLFSEQVTMLNASGFDLGMGVFVTLIEPMSQLPEPAAAYHVHIGFEEGFLGETYVSLREGAVIDAKGAPNLATSNLTLVKFHTLPFGQIGSYQIDSQNQFSVNP